MSARVPRRRLRPFEPRVKALLEATPDMPATVLAERVGWQRSIRWFSDNVRRLRPGLRPPDPADRLVWQPGDAGQCDLWFPPRKIPLEDGTSRRLDADLAGMLGLPPIPLHLGWRHGIRLARDYYVRLDSCDYSVDPMRSGGWSRSAQTWTGSSPALYDRPANCRSPPPSRPRGPAASRFGAPRPKQRPDQRPG